MPTPKPDSDRRPVSSLPRPPSYVSQTEDVPVSPSRAHIGRSRAIIQLQQDEAVQDVGISDSRPGRPLSRRLSDFAVPQLLPITSGSRKSGSLSPKRPQGARTESYLSYNRSASPDTSIRMPLMSEKNNWVDESPYEVPHTNFGAKAYSVLSDDDSDRNSLAPTTTNISDHEIEKPDYGPVPTQPQPRRRHKTKTTEVVNLTAGNLIIEREIPEKLKGLLCRHDLTEFTHVRYSAITCDPDDFVQEGFFLRQHASNRETEIVVVMTMYNEDETLFTRTLHGVIKNIAHLTSRTRSRTWGVDSWQKIVVLIIADGRRNVNPRVLDVLTALGVYQDGLAQSIVNGSPVQAHLYEYTTQYSMTPDLQFRGADKNIPPIQISFLLKEQNQKKLNSHRWALNGLAPNLQPNICVLLDVGTRPGSDSIYKLWKAFDMDSRIAGAAGEIRILAGRAWSALLNPLVASQNFEYKMSNLLDKPCESVFGYIGVLPGAFSAYRYRALVGDVIGVGPLEKYFKGENIDLEADVFQKNMYLAEDRILAFELIAKRDCDWLLKYVGDAYGETDCPNTVAEIIGQRRRWLNGATFASTYALWNFRRIWSTSHTTARKFALHIEFLYQAVQLLFTFFGLANFYLIFFFIAQSFGQKFHWASYTFVLLRYLCIMVTSAQFILALGNRPRGAKTLFLMCLVLYSIIMVYTLVCATYLGVSSVLTEVRQGGDILGDKQFANLVLSAITTTGVYFVVSLLYLDIWHMFTSFVPYMLLLPFYVCTLTIFAFCNIHDLSWGTKEEDVTEVDIVEAKVLKDDSNKVKVELYQGSDAEGSYEDALTNLRIRKAVPDRAQDVSKVQEDYFKEVRTVVVLCWLICNLVLMMGVSEYYSGSTGSNIYLSIVMYSVVLMTAFRFIGSLTYLILTTIQKIIGRKSAQVRTSALTVKAETKRLFRWGKKSQFNPL